MTLDEYNEMLMRERLMQRNGCGTAAVVIMLLLSVTLLCGCSTQYVPVETIVKEYVHSTDTIHEKDTLHTEKETIIREATKSDSTMLAKLGLQLDESNRIILVLKSELERQSHEKEESRTDTVYRDKEAQVPLPVERKLNRWEQICIDYGKIMIGATVVTFIAFVVLLILWLKRRFGHS